MVYVDNTILYAKNPEDINAVVQSVHDRDMELQQQEDIAGLLGVHIDRQPDGTIKLTQKGLIKRIIEVLNIDHLPDKKTGAKLGVVGIDEYGDPPNGTFNYVLVIGSWAIYKTIPDLTYHLLSHSVFALRIILSRAMSKH